MLGIKSPIDVIVETQEKGGGYKCEPSIVGGRAKPPEGGGAMKGFRQRSAPPITAAGFAATRTSTARCNEAGGAVRVQVTERRTVQ